MNKEQFEEKILKVEEKVLEEVREERKELSGIRNRALGLAGLLVLLVGGGFAGAIYFIVAAKTVSIEASQVTAPLITITPTSAGVLKDIFVKEGDAILPDSVVAQVGSELLKSQSGGLVVSTKDTVGKVYSPSEAVVMIIDPHDLRVIGHIEEDKGLADIHVGSRATFTVDAFGSKKYEGVVDEISPTARAGDVVFNISDKRQIQQFDIKVRFSIERYPELKNGMSAKLTIYK